MYRTQLCPAPARAPHCRQRHVPRPKQKDSTLKQVTSSTQSRKQKAVHSLANMKRESMQARSTGPHQHGKQGRGQQERKAVQNLASKESSTKSRKQDSSISLYMQNMQSMIQQAVHDPVHDQQYTNPKQGKRGSSRINVCASDPRRSPDALLRYNHLVLLPCIWGHDSCPDIH